MSMFSSSNHMPSSGYMYDDRRNNYKYPRSQHSSSSSSYVSSTFNQPSPSSSATSTSSSVRTPPDLLLNGATLAKDLTHSAKNAALLSSKQPIQSVQKYNSATTGYQTKQQDRAKETRYMTIAQMQDRLKILSKVTGSPTVKPDIPSPPSSVGLKGKQVAREASFSPHRASLSQKRKAEDRPSESSPEAQRPRRMSRTMNESSSSSLLSSFEPLSLPRVREWSKEQYIDTAAAYRHRGRELKHRGDRRLRESSTNYTSPINEASIAGLEQTDALLFYVYGFWCDDQGRGTCITENWNSLFGLLKYVYLRHEKNKATVLAGLCRLLESSVLRHIAGHEMRMLTHRLGKASSSIDPTSKEEMVELSGLMQKVVGDQERSNRLHAQARQSVLNMTVLQQHCPALARFCEKSMQSPLWASSDQAQLATRLDPCSDSASEPGLAASSTNGWCWPMDVSSPFPMLVCFGRAVLREVAREARVAFETESVAI